MDYEKFFKQVLTINIDIDELLRNINNNYFDNLFTDENLTYETMIDFIENYQKEIIENSLKDEFLIDDLLFENNIVDRTKRSTINQQYLEDLINKIKNREFDYKSLTLYFYIINFYNLYASKYDKKSIQNILELGINSIINNPSLVSKDGDKILSNQNKIEVTDKLLSWNKKCGSALLPNIFLFELLNNNIRVLLNSKQVKQDRGYQKRLSSLMELCDFCIFVRDSDFVPNEEELEQINNIYNEYNDINKSILLDSLLEEDTLLVHFIRDNDVNYQLVGNEIMNVNDSKNTFDNKQSNFFVNSYLQAIIPIIEEQTGRKFSYNSILMRRLLRMKLDDFNNIMNNKPLDRLPIKKREVGKGYKTIVRNTDTRLSCSLISKNNPSTHLDRKIGIILRPRNTKAILSTSLGYTSEKDFYDFRNDSVPCTDILNILNSESSVNETCVDTRECEIVAVLVLSNEKKIVERANRIAQANNTNVIHLTNNYMK